MNNKSPLFQSRTFVTGCTGLLGSHLVKSLLELGTEVVVLVRDHVPKSLFFSSDKDWNLSNKVTIVHGDLEDFHLIERTINEYEIENVFHLAAQTIVGYANKSPLATFKTNIAGTWNILEACRLHSNKIKRVLIASSDKAYGNLEGAAYNELTPLKGEHPYDVSKSCADLISQAYFKTYNLPITVTRCGNFFGPGDLNFNRIIPGTIKSILNNSAPVIRGDGKHIRDYIFVKDGAQAYISLAEKMQLKLNFPILGEAFNFSYGMRLEVLKLVESILELMNRNDLKPIVLNEVKGEIPVQCLNSNKAKEKLDWKPQFGFNEGLKQTIDWYQKLLLNTEGK